jgi:dihydrofolate synthase / folylpolyglutamate synthase
MEQIESIDEANEVMAKYVPITKELTGKDITLARIRSLVQHLGNPQNNLRVVHIAGTSGKTSTAYYVASLLQAAGQKVGLTVSPHMDSVTERIQINLQLLDEAEFCAQLTEILELIEDFQPQPSYFELLIAFAYWYFARQKVNYAVVETGLGGLHDATNVADKPDKVCVITDIGFDHMHVLGHTLAEIAAQKAGIIHPDNQAFIFDQGSEINGIVQTYADKQHAKLTILDEEVQRQKFDSPQMLTLPLYQQRNWLLARSVYEFIAERDGLPDLDHAALNNTLNIQVPGRMDIRHINGNTLVMDGAHNEPKMKAFVGSFQAKFPGQRAAVLLSLKEGKEFQEVLPLLQPITSQLILTTFTQGQDLPSTPIDPQILAAAAQKAGFSDVTAEPDQAKAYQQLLDGPEKIKIITGSFYLLSQVRRTSGH